MENMKVPNHIAIILDGNGRWAKAKGMPRGYGHIKGCANLESICDDIKDLGVKYLTVYAFSTENWKRSREEVEGLMKLFRSYLKKCMKSAEKNHMRVKIIGDPTAFDQDIQDKIRKLEEFSKDYDELYFQIALNYGSRDEITRGMRKLAQDVAEGRSESAGNYGGYDFGLSGYSRCSGSGSADQNQRRTETVQFPYVAAGIYRVLFYRCCMAGFS